MNIFCDVNKPSFTVYLVKQSKMIKIHKIQFYQFCYSISKFGHFDQPPNFLSDFENLTITNIHSYNSFLFVCFAFFLRFQIDQMETD